MRALSRPPGDLGDIFAVGSPTAATDVFKPPCSTSCSVRNRYRGAVSPADPVGVDHRQVIACCRGGGHQSQEAAEVVVCALRAGSGYGAMAD